ncbi:MAG: cob(I)yrinic acid a,c-diamide adenosyltransferase [Acidimicrobiia bacterium]|nr:cob(I)yrinic acid a,c-diamide adenosyltransferase [Acidimicrobiia bacterium]
MSASPSADPPHEQPAAATHTAPSLVIVNTGEGKGKSTAAMGILMRAVARGWRVAVIQFVKSGAWQVGEEKVARDLGVDWWTVGTGFTWDADDMEETEAVAMAGWEFAKEALASGSYDLLVLDEVTYPVNWGWIDADELVAAVAARPEHVSVVMTGRDAPESLLGIADTVTEMRNVRHAFDRGVRARRGIDY